MRAVLSLAVLGLLLACWAAGAPAAAGSDALPCPPNAGLYNALADTAPPSESGKILTLADPELREIVSHFKHPQVSAHPSAVVGVIPAGYQPYAFGSARPYWPLVIVAHPPQPVTPFLISSFTLRPVFAPIPVPGAPALPFLLMPRVDFIIPGW